MVSWFLTSVPRPFNGERRASSTDGNGTTGFPHAEEWSWTPTSYYIQKLTQNGSVTQNTQATKENNR